MFLREDPHRERFLPARANWPKNTPKPFAQRRAAYAKQETDEPPRVRLVRRDEPWDSPWVAAVSLLALFAFKQGGGGSKEAPPVQYWALFARWRIFPAKWKLSSTSPMKMTDDLIAKLGPDQPGCGSSGRASVDEVSGKRPTRWREDCPAIETWMWWFKARFKRERDKVASGRSGCFRGQPIGCCGPPITRARSERLVRCAK